MKNVNLALHDCSNALKTVLSSVGGMMTVQYERLVLEPFSVLPLVYGHCGLEVNDELVRVVVNTGFDNLQNYGEASRLDTGRTYVYRRMNRVKNLDAFGSKAGVSAVDKLNKVLGGGSAYSWPMRFTEKQ